MDSLRRIKSKDELFRLRDRCTKWCDENIVPNIGMPFFIHSPYSNTYYATEVQEYTNWTELEEFIKQGNAYLPEE
jgi:hypothetical protein